MVFEWHEQVHPRRPRAARQRPRQRPGRGSYTRKLLDKGVAQCAKKLGEEAVEAVLAAVSEDRERLIAEAADVLYHLFVVLEARGVTLAEVEAVLAARTKQIRPGREGVAQAHARKSDG